MVENDDLYLIEECLQGNTGVFEQIVEKYQKPLFNGAFGIVNEFDDAQDVTQTVFIKAFEKLHTFNPKYKLFSWLYRMLVNESLNFLSQKRRKERLNRQFISGKTNQREECHSVELKKDIRSALQELKPDYRVVIVLKHLQGYTYKEISDILHISAEMVKSRLYAARQSLKNILIQQDFIHDG
jgi:RNA polymerase sigma-70 factor (ECF subfamily)